MGDFIFFLNPKKMPQNRLTRRVKRSHRRKTRRTQRGGGMWQSYCVACGKPLSKVTFEELNEDYLNDDPPDTDWMKRNIGFNKAHDVTVILGEDDFYGKCDILDASFQSQETNEKLAELADEGVNVREFFIMNQFFDWSKVKVLSGYVLHMDCLTVLREASDKITFDFVKKLHDKRCAENDYQGQFYDLESAVVEQGVEYFESPLKNDGNREAILKACNLGRKKPKAKKPTAAPSYNVNEPLSPENWASREAARAAGTPWSRPGATGGGSAQLSGGAGFST